MKDVEIGRSEEEGERLVVVPSSAGRSQSGDVRHFVLSTERLDGADGLIVGSAHEQKYSSERRRTHWKFRKCC